MSDASEQSLKPANIFWRLLHGIIDDLIVTSLVLLFVWGIGLLSIPDQINITRADIKLTVETLNRIISLTAQVWAVFIIYAAAKFVYYVAFIVWCGQTPACRMLRLRVVMTNATPVGWADAVKRAVAGGIASHTPVIGHMLRVIDYLATLFNPRKRAVRDIVAGTMLVHVAPLEGRSSRAQSLVGSSSMGGAKNG